MTLQSSTNLITPNQKPNLQKAEKCQAVVLSQEQTRFCFLKSAFFSQFSARCNIELTVKTVKSIHEKLKSLKHVILPTSWSCYSIVHTAKSSYIKNILSKHCKNKQNNKPNNVPKLAKSNQLN